MSEKNALKAAETRKNNSRALKAAETRKRNLETKEKAAQEEEARLKRKADSEAEIPRIREAAIRRAHDTMRVDRELAVPLFERLVNAGVPVGLAEHIREAVRTSKSQAIEVTGPLHPADDEQITEKKVDVAAVLRSENLRVLSFCCCGGFWGMERTWHCTFSL